VNGEKWRMENGEWKRDWLRILTRYLCEWR